MPRPRPRPRHQPRSRSRSRALPACVALACAALLPAVASATDLSGALSVDDQFTLYLSTDDDVAGTPLLSGAPWFVTFTLAATALGPAPVYYLHVMATDTGAPGSFLASFTLSDARYRFANGTQSLVTNTTDWTVRSTGFDGTDAAPISRGLNGVAPWSTRPGIALDAEQIWSSDNCGSCTRYFSTPITAVPEPATWALFGLGMAAVGAAARRARA